uniref:DUF2442 domain-containing protein n=1 Tax=Candidatus Kentrum sp. LPFa TaxID=2126335 RepID=A0A450VZC5_9GAMM|nr:MAG: Protein of unknown function (DUF2442) [Candidatus Kentron sp. LPFa]VFK26112.1 MAG: Protein of unknown function (DUF2442) [Candidatus Kentron sp. LPFa]
MIEVASVSVVEDFTLALTFNTGKQGQFDMRPYLHYPVFQRLTNPGFFSLARVAYGTVTWPGEIDIAPERLYAESIEMDEQQHSGP